LSETSTQPNTIIQDGYILDAETGEVLGYVKIKEQFAVNDDKSCKWVLRQMLEAEADVEAIDRTPAVITARKIIANAEALKKARAGRLAWWHWRFDAELGQYAKDELDRQKSTSKTFQTLFGKISRRLVGGNLTITNKVDVLAWAKRSCPEAIKTTEEVQISKIPKDVKADVEAALKNPESLPESIRQLVVGAFVVTPVEEKVYIELEPPVKTAKAAGNE
jgi:hypothetical protein